VKSADVISTDQFEVTQQVVVISAPCDALP